MSKIVDKLKGWKTLIFNFLIALLALLESLDVTHVVESGCAILTNINLTCDPAVVAPAVIGFISVINMILRTLTTSPTALQAKIKAKKAEKAG